MLAIKCLTPLLIILVNEIVTNKDSTVYVQDLYK